MLATWPLSQAIVTASQLVSVILPQSAALSASQLQVAAEAALGELLLVRRAQRVDNAFPDQETRTWHTPTFSAMTHITYS